MTECTTGIKAILAQQITLEAQAFQWLTFLIYSQYELKEDNECTVSLFDSVGILQDKLVVNFTTFATVHNNGAQGGVGPSINPNNLLNGTDATKLLGCSDFCPNLFVPPSLFPLSLCFPRPNPDLMCLDQLCG